MNGWIIVIGAFLEIFAFYINQFFTRGVHNKFNGHWGGSFLKNSKTLQTTPDLPLKDIKLQKKLKNFIFIHRKIKIKLKKN